MNKDLEKIIDKADNILIACKNLISIKGNNCYTGILLLQLIAHYFNVNQDKDLIEMIRNQLNIIELSNFDKKSIDHIIKVLNESEEIICSIDNLE